MYLPLEIWLQIFEQVELDIYARPISARPDSAKQMADSNISPKLGMQYRHLTMVAHLHKLTHDLRELETESITDLTASQEDCHLHTIAPPLPADQALERLSVQILSPFERRVWKQARAFYAIDSTSRVAAQKLKLSERLVRTKPSPRWVQRRTTSQIVPFPRPSRLAVQLFNHDATTIRNLNLKHKCSNPNRVEPELVKLQIEQNLSMWKPRFVMHDFSLRHSVVKPYERIDLITTVLCPETIAGLQNVESLETKHVKALVESYANDMRAFIINRGKERGHDYDGKITVYA